MARYSPEEILAEHARLVSAEKSPRIEYIERYYVSHPIVKWVNVLPPKRTKYIITRDRLGRYHTHDRRTGRYIHKRKRRTFSTAKKAYFVAARKVREIGDLSSEEAEHIIRHVNAALARRQ